MNDKPITTKVKGNDKISLLNLKDEYHEKYEVVLSYEKIIGILVSNAKVDDLRTKETKNIVQRRKKQKR